MLLRVLSASEYVLCEGAKPKAMYFQKEEFIHCRPHKGSIINKLPIKTEESSIKNIIDAAFKAFHQMFQRFERHILFTHFHTLKR